MGTCFDRQVQGHVLVIAPMYNKRPKQWKHCSSGTKVCEPAWPHVHLLPAVANSFSQGEKDGGWYISPNGQVGLSILMWNGQNREFEVNVTSWWIRRMHYHIFSFTAESIKKYFCRVEIRSIYYSRWFISGACFQCLCTSFACTPVCHMCLYAMRCICGCAPCSAGVCTCPGVMALPCSRASRQLRAEVRTAAAVRPACHTRLGSRMSHRNFSDSLWKCLEEEREKHIDKIAQQDQRSHFPLISFWQ